jgi:hypothetical protein
MVSDDLIETAQGQENVHEHRIVIFREIGLIEPKGNIQKVLELTPTAYLQEASKVDAELITAQILKKIKLPVPPYIVSRLVEEVLRVIREVAVEDMKNQRAREKLAASHEAKANSKSSSKKKAPKTETYAPDDEGGLTD